MSINRAIITGNLTRDSELRSTAGGMAVLGFGVAVNDRRKNQQTGEWEDCPNFIDCTMFGARAESLSRFLTKGTKVSIEGKLRWSQWERDGQKKSKIEVIVDEIEWNNPQQNAQQAPSAPVYAPQAAAPAPVYAPQAYAPQPPQYQQTALGYAQQPVSQPAVQAAPQATYQANAQAPYQANRQASAHVPQPAPAVASAQVQQVALADEDIPF